ncbi:hypothetical protein RI367_004703 [Sorochytrium milnesiophthora]
MPPLSSSSSSSSSALPPEILLLIFQCVATATAPSASTLSPLPLLAASRSASRSGASFDNINDCRKSNQLDLFALCLVSRRFFSLVAPLLYRHPCVSTLKQLRSLRDIVERSALSTLSPQSATTSAKLPSTRLPYFSYIQGLNLASMDELYRCQPAVARLTYEVLVLGVSRSLEHIYELLPEKMTSASSAAASAATSPSSSATAAISTAAMDLAAASDSPAVETPFSQNVRRCLSSLDCSPITPTASTSITTFQSSPSSPSLHSADVAKSLRKRHTSVLLSPSQLTTTSPSAALFASLPSLARSPITLPRLSAPKITSLNLSFIKSLNLVQMSKTLLPHLPHLTHLNLSGTNKSDAHYIAIVSQAPHLTRLALSWNHSLTDLTLFAVGTHCPRLTHLDITNCREVTDAGMGRVAKNCPGMRVFAMNWCLRIANETLWYALRMWPHLRVLCIAGARASEQTVHYWWRALTAKDWTNPSDAAEAFAYASHHVAPGKRHQFLVINPDELAFYIDP